MKSKELDKRLAKVEAKFKRLDEIKLARELSQELNTIRKEAKENDHRRSY